MTYKDKILDSIEELPSGWRQAFGRKMAKELIHLVEKWKVLDYEVLQVKEKIGGLRWYGTESSFLEKGEEATREYYDWLDKYEARSIKTCIICGKERSEGLDIMPFPLPLCADCLERK